MKSIKSWWRAEINWETPSGKLLKKFLALLPKDRHFQITLYGSAPLQLTVDDALLSGDVGLFCGDDFDLASMVHRYGFRKEASGLHIEPGFELSFRTSPRWRSRAKEALQRHPAGNVTLVSCRRIHGNRRRG